MKKPKILSWNDHGKWRAKLQRHLNTPPVVFIQTELDGNEISVNVATGPMAVNTFLYNNTNVRISSRVPVCFSFEDYAQLQTAVGEARELLRKINKRGRPLHYKEGGTTLCGIKADGKTWTAANPTCKRCLELKGERIVKFEDSFAAKADPALVAEWHPENSKKPEEVTPSVQLMIKWRCACGYVWNARVSNRFYESKKSVCKLCRKKRYKEESCKVV